MKERWAENVAVTRSPVRPRAVSALMVLALVYECACHIRLNIPELQDVLGLQRLATEQCPKAQRG